MCVQRTKAYRNKHGAIIAHPGPVRPSPCDAVDRVLFVAATGTEEHG
jgi:hypothetical protein